MTAQDSTLLRESKMCDICSMKTMWAWPRGQIEKVRGSNRDPLLVQILVDGQGECGGVRTPDIDICDTRVGPYAPTFAIVEFSCYGMLSGDRAKT